MRPALLLVDLQEDFLAVPDLQPGRAQLVRNAAALLADCRRALIPVIHVWTSVRREDDRRLPHWRREGRWTCEAGSRGHATPPQLRPLAHEAVVEKSGFNPYASGELDVELRRLASDTLILAGLHLHACVRAAALESLERQLGVCIAEDAVASDDPVHAASTRRWLERRAVVFAPVSGITLRVAQLGPRALLRRSPRCTEEVLFEVPVAGGAEIDAAGAAAHEAWRDWRRSTVEARCEPLLRVARRIEASAPRLARQLALEIGKPVAHGLEEARRALANLGDVVRRCKSEPLARVESGGLVRAEPLGVIALVSPWNNPIGIPLGKLAPALAFGNTVVWKPAPAGHAVALLLLEWLREAGLPRDVLHVIGGDASTAQRLAEVREVAALTVTSSALAGHALQASCARRLLPFQAELSGNNAAIVWEDAELATAAARVAWGAFACAGQRCTANRRVIVHARLHERFVRELETATNRLAWGDPLDSGTEIGPLVERQRCEEFEALLDAAARHGDGQRVLRTHADQAAEDWVRAGAYARPAIVSCTDPDQPLVQEESMAPVLVVQRAADFEQALELCNGVRHGLVAALFSHDAAVQGRFLEEARAGLLKLNSSTAGVDVTLPFGGWKASGSGPPEHGEGDRLFYTRLQVVHGADEPEARGVAGAGGE